MGKRYRKSYRYRDSVPGFGVRCLERIKTRCERDSETVEPVKSGLPVGSKIFQRGAVLDFQ
jgi:hypothetical protein